MGSGIYIAMSGAIAQTEALDVTANNVANVGTPGYQADKMSFGEALAAKSKDTAYVQSTGLHVDPSQGVLVKSANPMDLALVGEGHFGVQTPQGPRYTRAGLFHIDKNNVLVDSQNNNVRDNKGKKITIPANTEHLVFAADGTITADGNQVATLELVRFTKDSLTREGANLFKASTAPMPAKPEVVAGFIENTKETAARGMVNMIKISKTYDALHRMIETYRDMDERAARSSGR